MGGSGGSKTEGLGERVRESPMRMSALVQWPLRMGRSTLPIFKNLMYRRRGKTVYYAASAACSYGFALLLQVPGTGRKLKKRER